jgi:xylulokinase
MQAHVAPGRYAAWGGSPSASALEWFQRECADANGGDWTHLMAAARGSRPGAGGVIFLPYLSALTCPVNDNRALGAFVGLSSAATRGDLCRAVIEGLNYQFLDIARTMEGCLGTRFQRVIATGGATRNAFWVQNKADVAGIPVEVSEIQDATSLGAAMIAGVALGLYASLDEAYERVKRPTRTCIPDRKLTARYAECFRIYKDLYPALRPACHSLYAMFKEEA